MVTFREEGGEQTKFNIATQKIMSLRESNYTAKATVSYPVSNIARAILDKWILFSSPVWNSKGFSTSNHIADTVNIHVNRINNHLT